MMSVKGSQHVIVAEAAACTHNYGVVKLYFSFSESYLLYDVGKVIIIIGCCCMHGIWRRLYRLELLKVIGVKVYSHAIIARVPYSAYSLHNNLHIVTLNDFVIKTKTLVTLLPL